MQQYLLLVPVLLPLLGGLPVFKMNERIPRRRYVSVLLVLELAALLVLGDRMRSAGRVNSQARGSEQGSCWTRNKDWGEGRLHTSDVC